MQRERREHGGQGSGAHALHTVIWSVARGNHNKDVPYWSKNAGRPFPGYNGSQSTLPLHFFPDFCEKSGKLSHEDKVLSFL